MLTNKFWNFTQLPRVCARTPTATRVVCKTRKKELLHFFPLLFVVLLWRFEFMPHVVHGLPTFWASWLIITDYFRGVAITAVSRFLRDRFVLKRLLESFATCKTGVMWFVDFVSVTAHVQSPQVA
jgi:hypothetical protein